MSRLNKAIGSLHQLVRSHSTEFYLSFALLWLLPAVVLAALGAVYLWQAGWFWWFSLLLLALSCMTWLVYHALSPDEPATSTELVHLAPLPEWSDHDNQVWELSLQQIEAAEMNAIPWQEIPQAMHEQLQSVARLYHGDEANAEYAFSLPELLLMLEIWSRNYRGFVIEHVPLSQDVKISTIQQVSQKSAALASIYEYIQPVIRVVGTLANPAGGVAAEMRSRLMSNVLGNLSDHMQRNLKQAIFEQVTQVAIDLYSGRLRLSEDELAAYRQSLQPPEQPAVTPLSVMLVGQVNAGKSSLLNALKARCLAEVDVLPTTQHCDYHHIELAEELEGYLIDTPGLDGNPETSKTLIKEAAKADLILWLSQANQPAKALDKAFFEMFEDYFQRNKGRRKPPIVLVTSHNDLLPVAGVWEPPYDLEQDDDTKVASMLGALRYTHTTIGLPEESMAVPVCLAAEHEPYNLDVLWELLLSVSDAARGAQLSKERMPDFDSSAVVARTLRQSAGLLRVGLKLAAR